MQQAAVAVGYPQQIAAELVGALGELYDNVLEHSQAPRKPGWWHFRRDVVDSNSLSLIKGLVF